MKITFLGTGTSQGVPVIACNCDVCNSLDFRNQRLRTSVHIQIGQLSIIIDAGPDFRQQVLREKIPYLNAIIFTHEHKDHTAGLDDIRAYNFKQKIDMPLYASNEVLEQIKNEYAYVFTEKRYPGIPQFDLNSIENKPFKIKELDIIPIGVMHYKLPIFGFRIGDFSYITDANHIAPAEIDKIRGSKVVVLNGLQKEPHLSHYTLAEAIEVLMDLKPEQAYLTHISHKLGLHSEVEKELPSFIKLAYDGLKLEL
jgi:phosphoribosyl 1,2-cyclic phosphate phosphodiesterase